MMSAMGVSASYAQTAPAAGDDNGQLGQIVVTAQKRQENVQDVPIAITAIDAVQLANTAPQLTSTSLQQFVPGLVQGNSGTAGATFLRGVGTEAGTVGTESPVPTYIDGIYLGINSLGVFPLNNIEQISVLKGPQGTLFGRNATGGAIQIATKNPNLNKVEAVAEAGYGNFDTTQLRFYGSAPITDTLAVNASILYKDRQKGTVYNVATGNRAQAEKSFAIQAKLLWQPTADTRVLLNGIVTNGRDLPSVAYFVQEGALSQDGRTTYLGPRTTNVLTDPYQTAHSQIFALTVDHNFGWAKLSNTVAVTDYRNHSISDQSLTTGLPNPGNIAPSAAALDADVNEVTEELQLQSADDSKLQWILGFFYFYDRTSTYLRSYAVPANRITFGVDTRLGTRSYAGYAQATYPIFTNTKLTAGLRYTRDEKTFNGSNIFGGVPPATLDRDVTFPKTTWRLALDHQFTSNILGYVSYNRGFRAGQYSVTSLTNAAASPETLDSYEIGLKNQFFDRKLRVNLAGFYYDYSNLQVRQNVGSPIATFIVNAAQARIYGLDVDFEARPTRALRIAGGFEVMSAKYTRFPSGLANFPEGVSQLGLAPIRTLPPGCTGVVRAAGAAPGGHTSTVNCNLTGNNVINAPKFSASLVFDYTVPSRVGEFVFSIGDKYTGKSYASADNVQVLKAYHNVNASANWTSTNGSYFGRLYVTNLTDHGRPAQLAFGLNTYEFLPAEARFYGFSVGYKY